MYYPPYPQGYYPPVEMVYHYKYGYLPPNKLGRKQIRGELNWLSGATLAMFLISLIIGATIGIFFASNNIYFDLESYPDSSGLPPYLYHALSCAISVLGTGLPFALYLLVRRPVLSQYIRTERVGFGTGLLFVLAGAGLCLAANYPAAWISALVESAGMSAGSYSAAAVPDTLSAVLYFISIAVMPAVFEEFAFRGVMLSALRKYGDLFALLVSTLLFGLMHMSVSSIPFAWICGLVLGYAYLRTGNIWVNVVIHFLNNAQAAAGELLYQYLPSATADMIQGLLFLGTMIVGLICLIILAATRKILGRPQSGPEKEQGAFIPASSKLAAVVTSPVTLLVIGVCLLYTVAGMLGIFL